MEEYQFRSRFFVIEATEANEDLQGISKQEQFGTKWY